MNCIMKFIRDLALIVIAMLIVTVVIESAKFVISKSSHCGEDVKSDGERGAGIERGGEK